MAHLDIADPIYNWLVDYFSEHQHSTRFRGSMSQLLEITASIIQGSVIGPVSYVVSASDLSTVTPGNSMLKYADDTYVVIPACNALSHDAELDNFAKWAVTNNLQLNRTKSVEIIFENRRRRSQPCYPPALPDIRRVTSIASLRHSVGLSVSPRMVPFISGKDNVQSSNSGGNASHCRFSSFRLCSSFSFAIPLHYCQ